MGNSPKITSLDDPMGPPFHQTTPAWPAQTQCRRRSRWRPQPDSSWLHNGKGQSAAAIALQSSCFPERQLVFYQDTLNILSTCSSSSITRTKSRELHEVQCCAMLAVGFLASQVCDRGPRPGEHEAVSYHTPLKPHTPRICQQKCFILEPSQETLYVRVKTTDLNHELLTHIKSIHRNLLQK